MNITFLDRESFHKNIGFKSPKFDHHWQSFNNTMPHEVIDHCGESQIIVTNKVAIDHKTLAACPNIKHIAVTATGYNIIDLDACQKQGVSVSNVPTYATTTVPEHVLNVSLSLCRQLNLYQQLVRDGEWQSSPQFCLIDKPIYDLAGKTFGIIGLGSLGEATGRLMHAIGMNVIYSARSEKNVDFAKRVSQQTLLETSDIVSLHCALTPETKNTIDQAALESMKDSAFLINTARGGVANEQAVTNAIEKNIIAGIGFDVLEQEPPRDNSSPLLGIAHYNNVILTPHTAWSSQQAMQNLSDTVISNIDAFYRGKQQNWVT